MHKLDAMNLVTNGVMKQMSSGVMEIWVSKMLFITYEKYYSIRNNQDHLMH